MGRRTGRRTTAVERSEILNNANDVSGLVERYGLTRATVLKWRRRGSPETVSTRPHRTRSTISPGDAAFLSGWRAKARMPLDDLMRLACVLGIKITSRSALDRSVRAAGAERLAPAAVRLARQQEPGHITLTVVRLRPENDGQSDTLVVLGIDQATCWLSAGRWDTDATRTSVLSSMLEQFPFRPKTIRFDDGETISAALATTANLSRISQRNVPTLSTTLRQIEHGVKSFNYGTTLGTQQDQTPARVLLQVLKRRLDRPMDSGSATPAPAEPEPVAGGIPRNFLTPVEASVRQRALEEAARMLVLRGVKGLSFNRLAEVLGTSGANLHYHFKTKALLIERVVSRYALETADVLSKIWNREDIDFEEKVVATYEFNRWRFVQYNDSGTYYRPWSLIARMRMEEDYLNERTKQSLRQFSAQVNLAIEAGVRRSVTQGDLDKAAPVEDIARQVLAIINSAGPVTQEARSLKALKLLYLGYVAMVRKAYGSPIR